ncbi:LLM class flavin-dependent oxidoreductase [Streptomyces sp. NPDC050433]|uniref:LLM class flavin-dependent oxidoreductase n=1 Tax=Streptomyces sp. NPDC050433 TaxID=3365615 RepID=UPI0037AA2646
MKLSVLDIIIVRADQTSSHAINGSLRLARLADELGFERYWIAEHHNMPDIAATNPPVLIAMIAGATERIRVGSGGVLLPNHAPLVVAEQFAILEAGFPGRIDLGIGRASGSDPLTTWALSRAAGASGTFSEHVDQVVAMMGASGAEVHAAGRRHQLRATPVAASTPAVWLLGSSDFSARLAAENGMPYVFAHHFSGQGTSEALALYRDTFRPSAALAKPATFLTVNACVAETEEEAWRRSLPLALGLLALRTGAPLQRQRLIEDAEKSDLTSSQRSLLDAIRSTWVIGSGAQARAQLEELAASHGVDEVMVNPVAGAYAGTDPATGPNREETLRLLAGVG